MPQPPADTNSSTGFDANLLAFTHQLRGEGVAVGTAELLDATAAIGHVAWADRDAVHGALSATLAKSPEDRRIFDIVFDRFFFRAAEQAALDLGEPVAGSQPGDEDAARIDIEKLKQQIAQALRDGSDGSVRDMARLAVAAFGQTQGGSGVVGVDVQRIRRELPAEDARAAGIPRDRLRLFEKEVRRELERQTIERTRSLPPARPLGDLERGLPTGPAQDLAEIHKVIAQLRRKMATNGQLLRGQKRSNVIDVRKTVRASLQTGGVPVVLKQRPKRPKRPEIFVLCDVSTSVTSSSVFFLSVLHALHDSFRKMRSFVFIERISEVTEVFEKERDFKKISRAITTDAGVADVSGYTDYGRVWSEFLAQIESELHPRATVIVLGDARTNGRPAREDLFAQVAARAGRTFWLNPEPKLYWNYGDSVINAYAEYCIAYECWTAAHLSDFVEALTRPGTPRASQR
ncbi:MAG: VWA domain-containing protein [Solirubrobacterales bacterium]|nr:VWA domain-containing protein [Solirubrobacterales bacterium]